MIDTAFYLSTNYWSSWQNLRCTCWCLWQNKIPNQIMCLKLKTWLMGKMVFASLFITPALTSIFFLTIKKIMEVRGVCFSSHNSFFIRDVLCPFSLPHTSAEETNTKRIRKIIAWFCHMLFNRLEKVASRTMIIQRKSLFPWFLFQFEGRKNPLSIKYELAPTDYGEEVLMSLVHCSIDLDWLKYTFFIQYSQAFPPNTIKSFF